MDKDWKENSLSSGYTICHRRRWSRGKNLQKVYHRITQQIEEAKSKGKKMLVMGDFKCKVVSLISK